MQFDRVHQSKIVILRGRLIFSISVIVVIRNRGELSESKSGLTRQLCPMERCGLQWLVIFIALGDGLFRYIVATSSTTFICCLLF